MKYQHAVDVLNELDYVGNGFDSCQGYKAAMDMVKLKETCFCIKKVHFVFLN